MWIGFLAAFTGLLYALVKFATALSLRRIQEQLAQTQYEVRKIDLRIEALKEKLDVERSKKRTAQRDTERIRQNVELRYARLQALLPQAMLPRLERCRSLRADPAGGDLKLLQDLDLLEKIDEALEPLSLLFVRLPPDPAGRNIALSHLVALLDAARVRFHGPDGDVVVALFSHPGEAIALFRRFLRETPEPFLQNARGSLYSGMELRGEESLIHRLLVFSLRKGRRLLEQAPEGSLLINEEARQALGNDPEIRRFEADEPAYVLSWAKRGADS